MSTPNRNPRRVAGHKPRGPEKTLLVEAGSAASLPKAVGPPDAGPKQSSWSRLDHLYRISKLLANFETTRTTVAAILGVISNTLPLRSAILIDETAGRAQISVWQNEDGGAQALLAARDHAEDNYAYLTGSRSILDTTSDIARERRPALKLEKKGGSDNFMVLPLLVSRRPIFGVLQLECTAKCSEADLLFADAIVNQLAIALDRDKARQQEMAARQRAETGEKRMRFLSDASRLLSASFDYRSAWENMARLAVGEIADYCFIDIRENKSFRRTVVLSPERAANLTGNALKGLLKHVVKHVFETRHPAIHPAAGNDFTAPEEPSEDSNPPFESYMCVPLRINEHSLGTLTLVSAQPGHLYNERDLVLLEDLARRAVVAFENAQLYADALQAIRSRDEVLNAVSHDLKAPLTVVLGFVQMFLSKSKPDEPLICERPQVEAIHRQANQMKSLIDDLLDTAKIEARHLYVDREVCRIEPLIIEAMDLPKIMAAGKEVELKSEIAPDLPGISVDRQRIRQVFANLIGNAIKFTASRGTVTVSVHKFDENDIQFCVEDTGPGIPEEEVPHLFDRFWQAKKTARHGTGLGLFIVKGIVEGHGGRIWVESKVGAGSKFFFTLPVEEGQA